MGRGVEKTPPPGPGGSLIHSPPRAPLCFAHASKGHPAPSDYLAEQVRASGDG